jgi:hypothetical protein
VYLTIANIFKKEMKEFYSVKIPNSEVQKFYDDILTDILKTILIKDISKEAAYLGNAILFRDEASLTNIIAKVFS